jgi:5-methylthioadenosine/S-adenosylhomocysteine deaminase
MQTIDTLLYPRWIVPVEPHNVVLEDYCLAIHDGRILDILPNADARQKYQAHNKHNLSESIVIPGLVNAHTHAAMSLFRGLADDLPLMEWLEKHIWPAETRWVNTDFVHDGTQLAVAEMLCSGTTCFNDMYFYPDITAQVADRIGIRAVVGLIVIDFPTVWANDADEYIHKGIEIHDHYRNHQLINTAFAPHAPYTVSDVPLKQIATLADELDINIHMHVHETAFEVQQAEQKDNIRPLQRLLNLGLVSPRLNAVHMTQLIDDEITQLATLGANAIHCPESNLKLASGFCPVQKLLDAGVTVGIGTDGAASNNDLDMLGETRSAALLAKAVANNASAVPAVDALRMATLNGAKILGLDKNIGSLEIGKAADVVAIQMDEISSQPTYNPVSQLIYSASRSQVTDVWVAGKQLLKEKILTSIDQRAIIKTAKKWADKISQTDNAEK